MHAVTISCHGAPEKRKTRHQGGATRTTVIPDFPPMVWPAPAVHVTSDELAVMVVMPDPARLLVAFMTVAVVQQVMEVKLEQPENALSPMVVTEFPMVTDVRLEQ
jgi:hypothetical protein